eukprot:jgi/Mesvir1/12336/Mv00522-RA.1
MVLNIVVSMLNYDPRRTNGAQAQGRAVRKLILYHVGVNLPLMLLSYPAFQAMGFTSALPLPSWRLVALQLVFFFIVEDFVFYWGHRALHTKFLYRHIHSVHHEFSTPFGITAEYAHPVEILFLGVATVIGPAITGCHLSVLWLWMSVRLMETVDVHCGYDFPWAVNKFFPLYCGADYHDFHHRLVYTKSGNYASTFTWMDRLFGTDQLYHTLKANQAKDAAKDTNKDAVKAS